MDLIATIHLLCAGLALALGANIALTRKGTARHRRLAHWYTAAMLGLNISALMHYELNGRFNVFHALAFVSLATLAWGWITVLRRRANWRPRHARAMLWSYVGLLAAAAGEIASRAPFIRDWTDFGIVVGGASMVVSIIGAIFIERTARALRRQLPLSAR